jgi:hypothetical protein
MPVLKHSGAFDFRETLKLTMFRMFECGECTALKDSCTSFKFASKEKKPLSQFPDLKAAPVSGGLEVLR